MADSAEPFLTKAEESLAGAEPEFANHWYNNCASRCYYASFQDAVAALIREGIGPVGPSLQWGHDFVQAQFNGRLINARKVYPADLRDVLGRNRWLRGVADYKSGRDLSDAYFAVLSVRCQLGPDGRTVHSLPPRPIVWLSLWLSKDPPS